MHKQIEILTKVVFCMMAPAIAMAPSSSIALAATKKFSEAENQLKTVSYRAYTPQFPNIRNIAAKNAAHMRDLGTLVRCLRAAFLQYGWLHPHQAPFLQAARVKS